MRILKWTVLKSSPNIDNQVQGGLIEENFRIPTRSSRKMDNSLFWNGYEKSENGRFFFYASASARTPEPNNHLFMINRNVISKREMFFIWWIFVCVCVCVIWKCIFNFLSFFLRFLIFLIIRNMRENITIIIFWCWIKYIIPQTRLKGIFHLNILEWSRELRGGCVDV